MELIKVVCARDALQKLIGQDIPMRQAYALMKLTDKMNVHLGFYGQEIAKAGGDEEKIEKLNSFEVDNLPEDKVRISLLDSVLLSASDIKSLESFVEFGE
jgi:hypothetical protein